MYNVCISQYELIFSTLVHKLQTDLSLKSRIILYYQQKESDSIYFARCKQKVT